MKKIVFLAATIFFSLFAFAQEVSTYETTKKVDNMPRKGMATTLHLDYKFVEKLWRKKLKEFGGKSTLVKEGSVIIEGASIPPVSKNAVKIVATIYKVKDGVEIFWAIDVGTSYIAQGEDGRDAVDQILVDFGKKAYIEDINIQIKEAERALIKSNKLYQKKIQEGENIVSRIEKNKIEKIKLENELLENGEELIQLQKDQEQNKIEQEQAKEDSEKMKLAVDAVRAKLDKVY